MISMIARISRISTIACPVCAAPNHHLRVVCTSCGGFVQGRIENLDLFSTLWRLIESPGSAFKSIALSRHKNYVTILSALAGVGLMFGFFWYADAGDHAPSTLALLAAGAFAGLIAGTLLVPLFAALIALAGPAVGASIGFRNARAVAAYALTPFIFSAFLLQPLVLYTFGGAFFGTNPPASMIDPVSYYIFAALETAAALWSFSLMVIGIRVLAAGNRLRAIAAAACIFAFIAGAAVSLEYFLEPAAEEKAASAETDLNYFHIFRG